MRSRAVLISVVVIGSPSWRVLDEASDEFTPRLHMQVFFDRQNTGPVVSEAADADEPLSAGVLGMAFEMLETCVLTIGDAAVASAENVMEAGDSLTQAGIEAFPAEQLSTDWSAISQSVTDVLEGVAEAVDGLVEGLEESVAAVDQASNRVAGRLFPGTVRDERQDRVLREAFLDTGGASPAGSYHRPFELSADEGHTREAKSPFACPPDSVESAEVVGGDIDTAAATTTSVAPSPDLTHSPTDVD